MKNENKTIEPRDIVKVYDDFLPFKITEGINNSVPFVAVSDTFPNANFEVWTKENWDEMKEKNFEKSVDSFKPIW